MSHKKDQRSLQDLAASVLDKVLVTFNSFPFPIKALAFLIGLGIVMLVATNQTVMNVIYLLLFAKSIADDRYLRSRESK